MVDHSFRTFHLGAELLSHTGRTYDAEILFVGSLLHDLALGTDLDDGTTPFNVRGAGLATRESLLAGKSEKEANLVYDAIALHMEIATADDPRAEVAGVHLGAAADVIGLRIERLPSVMINALIEKHPRAGMKEGATDLISAEATAKPFSGAATLIRDFGFLELIQAAPFVE